MPVNNSITTQFPNVYVTFGQSAVKHINLSITCSALHISLYLFHYVVALGFGVLNRSTELSPKVHHCGKSIKKCPFHIPPRFFFFFPLYTVLGSPNKHPCTEVLIVTVPSFLKSETHTLWHHAKVFLGRWLPTHTSPQLKKRELSPLCALMMSSGLPHSCYVK